MSVIANKTAEEINPSYTKSSELFWTLKSHTMSFSRFIGEKITGKQFNQIAGIKTFIKLTNFDETHNGYQFHDGLNVDTIEFDPSGSCSKGGFYFTHVTKAHMWIAYNSSIMYYMRSVTIPDNANVYIEIDKFKVDRLILGEKKRISREIYMEAVSKDGLMLRFVPLDMCDDILYLEAVKNNGFAIQYVPTHKMSKNICLAAVKRDGMSLKYIPYSMNDIDICTSAVTQYGSALIFVPDYLIDESICRIALRNDRDGDVIKIVPNHIKKKFDIQIQTPLSKL